MFFLSVTFIYKFNMKNISEFKNSFEDVNDVEINIIYHNIYNGNDETIVKVTDKNDVQYLYNTIHQQKGKLINKKECLIGGTYHFEFINIKNNKTVSVNINQNQLNIGNHLYEVEENLTLLIDNVYKKYRINENLI